MGKILSFFFMELSARDRTMARCYGLTFLFFKYIQFATSNIKSRTIVNTFQLKKKKIHIHCIMV